MVKESFNIKIKGSFSNHSGLFTKVILLFQVCLLLAGCINQPAEEPISESTKEEDNAFTTETPANRLDEIKSMGILKVGTALTEPFEYHDPQTGELVGFDVDIAQRIAEQLNAEIQWVEMPFANLIPALEDQKVDMAIAAMYITPEREELVDFAEPYINTGLVMVVQSELAPEVKSVDSLSGLQVGVKIGSTGAQLAQELRDNGADLIIVEYKNTLESLLELEVERVDVVFNDYLNTLVYLKDSHSDLQIVKTDDGEILFMSWVGLGIAVTEGDEELLSLINATLSSMQQDGSLDQLNQLWLASTGNDQ